MPPKSPPPPGFQWLPKKPADWTPSNANGSWSYVKQGIGHKFPMVAGSSTPAWLGTDGASPCLAFFVQIDATNNDVADVITKSDADAIEKAVVARLQQLGLASGAWFAVAGGGDPAFSTPFVVGLGAVLGSGSNPAWDKSTAALSGFMVTFVGADRQALYALGWGDNTGSATVLDGDGWTLVKVGDGQFNFQ